MEETDHKIDFQFQITLEWRESDRVVYYNLNQDTSLNALSDDEINTLWLPSVIYDNTDQKESPGWVCPAVLVPAGRELHQKWSGGSGRDRDLQGTREHSVYAAGLQPAVPVQV